MNILQFIKRYNLTAGGDILDQPTPKKRNHKVHKDSFNPSKITLSKVLTKLLEMRHSEDLRADPCYSISQLSGFTLTLSKKYHNDDDYWLHCKIRSELRKSTVWKNKSYIIFPEFTKKGTLHYHGIMWNEYEADVMRCVKWWRRKYGFVKPELQINNRKNWLKYITKDYGKVGLCIISNKICLFN